MSDDQPSDQRLSATSTSLLTSLRRWTWARLQLYVESFSFVGLVVAILFFAASVSPSLLPRPYVVQGILSGFSLAIGYGLGIAGVWFWRFLQLREPSDSFAGHLRKIAVVLVAVIFFSFLWRMTYWQNSIRELMEMPPVETGYPYRIGFIAVGCAVVLVFLGRLFDACSGYASRLLMRYMPQRIANTVGVVLVGFLAMLLFNKVIAQSLLDFADRTFDRIDSLSDDGVVLPSRSLVTGSSESLVTWESIGRRGKNFIAEGPTKDQIADFTRRDAQTPIRVFVGLRSRPTAASRADLAVEELKRVGGFDRKVLIVSTPTGTGWLDPGAVDTVEYLHGGDTAIVSIQYSYLPSWITILVDPNRSREAAHALFDAVYAHWTTLPKDARPQLYLQGLSLGAMGSETSADLYTIFDDPIQGAVFSGTPFPSSQWREFIRSRKEGSLVWLPTFRDGSMVRFMNQDADFDDAQQWGSMRNVYIQYASDPMVWFSPTLAYQSPQWLREQRGKDVSPYLKWYPIVTFLQVAFDLPMATSVPVGYGHNYSPASYIDAWVAVTAPENWDNDDTRRLKEQFAIGEP